MLASRRPIEAATAELRLALRILIYVPLLPSALEFSPELWRSKRRPFASILNNLLHSRSISGARIITTPR